MYFLAKNFRTCSKTFRSPGSLKLYRNGVLNWDYLAKNASFFLIHPEKLRQQLRERDAHMLCQFFDSEEYKRKVTAFLETQSKILSRKTMDGLRPGPVKYQHVLSCAQPTRRKEKVFVEKEMKQEIKVNEVKAKKRIKIGTIIEEILKKKAKKEGYFEEEMQPAKLIREKDNKPQKLRHRTTIMPIFLKKIKQKQESELEIEEPTPSNFFPVSGKQFQDIYEKDYDPFYPSVIHRSNLSTRCLTTFTKKPKIDRLTPSKTLEHSASKSRLPSSKLTVSTSKTTVSTKLYPKKTVNMNLKSYSQLLLSDLPNCKASKPSKSKKEIPLKKNKVIEIRKNDLKDGFSTNQGIYRFMPDNVSSKNRSMELLVDNVQKSRRLDLRDNFEGKNTMDAVLKNKNVKYKKKNEFVLMSLFEKVKIGTTKIQAQTKPAKIEATNPPATIKIAVENIGKKSENNKRESFTYKIVSQHRQRQEDLLKEKFKLHPPYWKSTFLLSSKESNVGKAEKDHIADDSSVKTRDFLNYEEQRQKLGTVSKNIKKHMHRPIPHFVENASGQRVEQLNQFSGFHKYLLRLPKSTPEGYRVLMYGVRDPDPTKMNFNDVVKGFCMYNDCVLSEDGLQDGYIVIFDMKDVSIGHLARVSLPALKCFMYYIQDAHPCRLKSIHVLNTATWIHHVMRLIVPLVRSELLNLVKFHKGTIPDNFPVELLPMDYGGEAPTIEDLDQSTKSLLDKYRDWLIETSHFKADESKRVKKASWWGLFGNKSSQQVELDEKTILKNLQID